MTTTRKILISAATGLVLATAACSSSSSGSGSAGKGIPGLPTGTTGSSGSSAAGSAAGGSAAGGSGAAARARPGRSIDLGGGKVVGKDKSPWCDELRQASKNDASLLESGDPTKLPPNWKQITDKLVADARGELQGDLRTLVKADEAIAAGNGQATGVPGYMTAAEHVAGWLQSNCASLWNELNPGLTAAPTG